MITAIKKLTMKDRGIRQDCDAFQDKITVKGRKSACYDGQDGQLG